MKRPHDTDHGAYCWCEKPNGYPVRTHKRDVYWRMARLLRWDRARWWDEVSRSPSIELSMLEELVRSAAAGNQTDRDTLRRLTMRQPHRKGYMCA